MSRVFIDTSVVGESWFSDIVQEMLKSKKIRFAYTEHPKLSGEEDRCRKLRQLYQIAGKIGIRDDIDVSECDKHVNFLNGLTEWINEKACNDPHVFAMTFIKPIQYVFTSDTSMAKCRGCLSGVVDAKYCGFRLIASKDNYDSNRHLIHS